ncbi:class II aldolase/adducin family protein [Draconibacterium sp. IB214405]|uniref:class II aldolase/adducin family protein n=1 Tax=Draconibacterium sp. IB214405 TaxID=3097352 RepID=UPI002A144CFE|nr:class II aldolase/adducin family protein [Draconibacterium sp. IB214405]MDX8338889.1 class II aldolase/adducin family protein [Draconibacterium sp. IB214405]
MRKLNTKWMHPRDQIIMIIDKIYKGGLTTTSGGNISIIDDDGDVWVTPSAIDKGTLRPTDIICVKKDGSIEGRHKPSSEYPFHIAIYKCRPEIKAVIHAHPPALVSFSIVRQIPDTNVIPQAKHVCGPIGYAPYALPGSNELGDVIADEFAKGVNAVIMENHGTVVGGCDLSDAYQRFETMEFCARTLINGSTIGKPNYLSDEQIDAFENQIPRLLPEMKKVEHPSDERAIREQIQRIVLRACDQGMMISSYGTVSVRWKGNDFLITPTNVVRWDIQLKDIVQIKDGKREPGKIPSRSTWLHQEIYKRFPHINSIILTQTPYLMAYSVTGEKIDVRTIPESWIFLQDIPNVPFGSHFAGEETILNTLGENTPAVIINNDSVLVTGDKLLGTFDKLEVAEFSAKSLTMGASLGKLVPINQEQIEDLRKKFLS